MADADYIHHQLTIDQVAYDAVIAHSIPPGVCVALHDFALAARVALGNLFKEPEYPALYRPV